MATATPAMEPWAQIQRDTYTAWANEQLGDASAIGDVVTELRTGVALCRLAEELSGRPLSKRFVRRPRTQEQWASNLQLALARFKREGVRLDAASTRPEPLIEQNPEAALHLFWALIEHYQLGGKEASAEGKPRHAAQNELLAWVRYLIGPKSVFGLDVRNFSSDWRDGRALCALTEACKPGSIPDIRDLPDDPLAIARQATRVAHTALGVPSVLSAAHLVSPACDRFPIITYLSGFRQAAGDVQVMPRDGQASPLKPSSRVDHHRLVGSGASEVATVITRTKHAGTSSAASSSSKPRTPAKKMSTLSSRPKKASTAKKATGSKTARRPASGSASAASSPSKRTPASRSAATGPRATSKAAKKPATRAAPAATTSAKRTARKTTEAKRPTARKATSPKKARAAKKPSSDSVASSKASAVSEADSTDRPASSLGAGAASASVEWGGSGSGGLAVSSAPFVAKIAGSRPLLLAVACVPRGPTQPNSESPFVAVLQDPATGERQVVPFMQVEDPAGSRHIQASADVIGVNGQLDLPSLSIPSLSAATIDATSVDLPGVEGLALPATREIDFSVGLDALKGDLPSLAGGAAASLDLPDVDVPDVELPSVDVKAPTFGKVDVPDFDVPAVTVRKVDVPDLELPEVDVPGVKAPKLGKVDVPDVELPSVDVEGPTLGKVDVPDIDVPAVTVPKVHMPDVNVPDVELPDVDVSGVRMPRGGIKAPTFGKVDVPDLELPEVDVPGVKAPKLGKVDVPDVELPSVDVEGPTLGKVDVPDIDVPAVTVPKVHMPDVNVPDVELPDVDVSGVRMPRGGIKAPTFGKVDVPDIDVPEVDVPEVDVPEVDVPEVDVPGVKMPKAGTKAPTFGKVDVPDIDVPAVTVSKVDLPNVDVPEVDVPDVDIPGVKMPRGGIKAPTFGKVDVPDLELPEVEVPGVKAPKFGKVDVPDVKAPTLGRIGGPDVELPAVAVPKVELPDADLSDVEFSDVDLPDGGDVDIALPSVAAPNTKLPSIPIKEPVVTVPDVGVDIPAVDLPGAGDVTVQGRGGTFAMPGFDVKTPKLGSAKAELPKAGAPDLELHSGGITGPAVNSSLPTTNPFAADAPQVKMSPPKLGAKSGGRLGSLFGLGPWLGGKVPGSNRDGVEIQGADLDFGADGQLRLLSGEAQAPCAAGGIALPSVKLEPGPMEGGIPYTVAVHTSDIPQAGTEGPVTLSLAGQDANGHSAADIVKLEKLRCKAGGVALLNIKLQNMATPQVLTVTHTTGPWHPDKVVLVNERDGTACVFCLDDWLNEDGASNSITVEATQIERYEVTVHTSDKPNAGTDAKVVCQLHGEDDSTQRVQLAHSLSHYNKFESGNTDKFVFLDKNVGDIRDVTIGHNKRGLASAWHVRAVEVLKHSNGHARVFEFDHWLPKEPEPSAELTPQGLGDAPTEVYHLTVATSDLPAASSDADVQVSIVGSQGTTTPVTLTKPDGSRVKFDRASTEGFAVRAEPVGDVQAVRVAHGRGSNWHLERLGLVQESSGRAFECPCEDWFPKKEAATRDIAARDSKDLVPYHIEVVTAHQKYSGTRAKVSMTVVGVSRASDECVEPIRFWDANKQDFGEGRTAVFKRSFLKMHHPNAISLAIDDEHESWLPEEVRLRNMETGATFSFICREWFGKNADDHITERTLVPQTVCDYTTTIATNDIAHAGTGGRTHIVLIGAGGRESKPVLLKDHKSLLSSKGFKKGEVETITFNAEALEPLEAIRLGTDGTDGWHPGAVTVAGPRGEYRFRCDQWLDRDRADGATERVLAVRPAELEVPYEIVVVTDDERDAGTTGQVFVEVAGRGADGATRRERVELYEAAKGAFRQGASTTFRRSLVGIARPTSVTLGHDKADKAGTWGVDQVVLTNTASGESTPFLFRTLIGAGSEGGAMSRTVAAAGATATYHVTVETEDHPHFGTKAQVFVALVGAGGQETLPITLQEGHAGFGKGSTMAFDVGAEDVEPLEAIRLGTDGTDGWHPGAVTVAGPRGEYRFRCDQWLDRDRADGATERVLAVRPTELEVPYEIVVVTDDERDAGTTGQVFVEVAGRGADGATRRERVELYEAAKGAFRQGASTTFRRSLVGIARPTSVTLGHDKADKAGTWGVDQVVLTNTASGESTPFLFRTLIGAGSEGGAMSRTVAAAGATATYHVTVETEDHPHFGTKAQVFVALVGAGGQETLPITLQEGHAGFGKGSTMAFDVGAEDVEPLEAIRLGTDGTDGWHPGAVTVAGPRGEYRFRCDQWLDRDRADGATERVLAVRPTELEVPYEIVVVTDDERDAGTTGQVFVEVAGRGADGATRRERVELYEAAKGAFRQGASTTFRRSLVGIARPTSVTLGHDKADKAGTWGVDQVVLTNTASGESTPFLFRTLIGAGSEGGAMSRTVAAAGATATYHVTVETEDHPHFGTKAQVFVALVGAGGQETLPITLQEGHAGFGKGSTMAFDVGAEDVEPLEAIRLGTDGTDGWHPGAVTVAGPRGEYRFRCDQWLDRDRADGATERVLAVRPTELEVPYEIVVVTDDERDAGTTGQVFVEVAGRGADGATRRERMELYEAAKGAFRQGASTTFRRSLVGIARPTSVTLGHDKADKAGTWGVDQVVLTNTASGESTPFLFRTLIGAGSEGGAMSRTVAAAGATATYHVTVETEDHPHFGTKAQVFVALVGAGGQETLPITLQEGHAGFGKGSTMAFDVGAEDVEPLEAIRLGTDGTDGWHPGAVTVAGPRGEYRFRCDQWLDRDRADGATERVLAVRPTELEVPYEIVVVTDDERDAGTTGQVFVEVAGRGADGATRRERVELYEAAKGAFRQGASTTFRRSLVGIARPTSVTLGHDKADKAGTWRPDLVALTNTSTGVRYPFLFRTLIGAGSQDGSMSATRRYAPTDEFAVAVVTSDVRNAGTDSDVFITIMGTLGSSGELRLASSDTHANKFERNHSDEFDLTTAGIGDVASIAIRTDGSGLGAAWHLKEVRLTQRSSGQVYLFPADCWFSKSEGLEKTLQAQASGDGETYDIEVVTSNAGSAGTDAAVSLTVMGESGAFGPVVLDEDSTGRALFEQGHKNRFSITNRGVGVPKAVALQHNGSGFGADWLVEAVFVTPSSTGERHRFPFNRWVREGEPVEMQGFAAAVGVPYQIDVHTAPGDGSGTDVEAITLRVVGTDAAGAEVRSDVPLLAGDKSALRPGAVASFTAQLAGVERPLRARVSHDAAGEDAREDWLVDKVVFTNQATSAETTILCRDWVEGAGMSRSFAAQPLTAYTFRVTTSNLRHASTSLVPWAKLVSADGTCSAAFHLEPQAARRSSLSQSFRKAKKLVKGTKSVTEKQVEVAEPLAQMIVGLHGNDAWHLDSIEVTATASGQTYYFPLQDWIGEERGGADERTLAVRDRAAEVRHQITVHTADVAGNGTDCEVFLTVRGLDRNGAEAAETIKLWEADENAFAKGKAKTFERNLVVVKPREIEVGHNGRGKRPRWNVDQVVLLNTASHTETTFIVRAWVGHPEHDGAVLSRTATLKPIETYAITTFTSDKLHAGTDANVCVEVRGAGGATTGALALVETGEGREATFGRGCDEEFVVQAEDVGELAGMSVWHDNSGTAPDWHLEKVEVTCRSTGLRYVFPADCWLDGQILRRELKGTRASSRAVYYEVEVHTSDCKHAGTGAPVLLVLYGRSGGASPALPLNSPMPKERAKPKRLSFKKHKLFDRGTVERFMVEAPDLTPLSAITVSTDGSDGWHLDSVKVSSQGRRGQEFQFPCRRWLSSDREDGAVERTLPCRDPAEGVPYQISVSTVDGTCDANVFVKVVGSSSHRGGAEAAEEEVVTFPDSGQLSAKRTVMTERSLYLGAAEKIVLGHDAAGKASKWLPGKVEMFNLSNHQKLVFPCGELFGAGVTAVELQPADVTMYRVEVATSDLELAGTDAGVSLTVIGKQTSTVAVPLSHSMTHSNPFERGSTDLFEVEQTAVGDIASVKIEHNSKGRYSDWHVDHLAVDAFYEGPTLHRRYVFPCARWLAESKGDGLVERVLRPDPMVPFKVAFKTARDPDAGTHAAVFLTVFGYSWETFERSDMTEFQGCDFKAGKKAEFSLMLNDVAWPTRIEVGHNGSGDGAEWLVDEVTLTNLATDQSFSFPCGVWLNSAHDRKTLNVRPEPPRRSKISLKGRLLMTSHVQFYPWTSTVTHLTRPYLEGIARYLQAQPELMIDVVGHCNGYVASQTLRTLCMSRAEAAIRALVDLGVEKGRLSAHIGGCRRETLLSDRPDNACVVFHTA